MHIPTSGPDAGRIEQIRSAYLHECEVRRASPVRGKMGLRPVAGPVTVDWHGVVMALCHNGVPVPEPRRP